MRAAAGERRKLPEAGAADTHRSKQFPVVTSPAVHGSGGFVPGAISRSTARPVLTYLYGTFPAGRPTFCCQSTCAEYSRLGPEQT